MTKWIKLYQNNLKLDKLFSDKYSKDQQMYHKNCIELLTELGELANETKCFKYWSIKKPAKEKVLDEYADCLTMAMYFLGYYNLDLPNVNNFHRFNNILELFNHIFTESTKLYNEPEKSLVENIYINIYHIKDYLDITEEELQLAIENKHKIIYERLNSDY